MLVEIDDDGFVSRQVEFGSMDGEPVTAAALVEVLDARDEGDVVAVQAYERKYGVVAEGDTGQWGHSPITLEEITSVEFEKFWAAARVARESTTGR
ncbi:hypothetical protein [Nocardia sp. NPDC050717]|uniref:hypothetical protein n=1 Tax=Nocardia sp. NPDC050717 TaxID=3157221 RepID=UPI0033FD3BA9